MRVISNRVINTILSLKNQMSAPLIAVSKAVEATNRQLEIAKEQVRKYESVLSNSNKAIDQAKNTVSQLSKEQNINSKQIEKVKEAMEKYSNTVGLTEKQTSNYSKQLEDAKSKLNGLEQAQELNTKATEAAKNAMMSHEKIIEKNSEQLKKVKGQVREYSKSVSENSKKVQEAKKKIEEWGKSAVGAMDKVVKRSLQVGATVATALAGFSIKTGFGEAMDMEGYKMQLETATKSTEKAAERMSSAVKFANSTPFETGEVVEATAILEAMGVSSEKWLKDIADMAGGTNKGMLQATEAMVDATKGEFERLKQFGISKEMLTAEAAKKYGKDIVFNKMGQVKDRLKLETILQETMQAKFEGGAQKQAKTMKGLVSTVLGVTKASLAKIVGITEDGTIRQGSLYEKVKEQIEKVVEVLNKWQEDGTIQRIGETVTQSISTMIEFFKGLFEFVNKHRVLIEGILVFVGSIYVVIKALTVLKAVVSVISVVMAVLNGTILLSPLGWLIIGIAGVATGFYLLWQHMDSIVGMFKNVFSWVQNLLNSFGKFSFLLGFIFGGPVVALILGFIQHFEKIVEIAKKAFGYIKKIFDIEDKEINLVVKKDEDLTVNKDENISVNSSANTKNVDAIAEVKSPEGLGAYTFPKEGLVDKPKSKGGESKNSSQTQNEIKKTESQINITIQGDVYGFDNFKEKVAEAVVKIYNQNKSNLVR